MHRVSLFPCQCCGFAMSLDTLTSHEASTDSSDFDSTHVMTAIDDDTALIPAVPPAKFFEPIAALETPEVNPARDRAAGADAELVIYDCGTTAPGYVHDPCQHSTVQVLCCTCAGCMFDRWSCGTKPVPDGWLWWEAQQIGMRWDPWVRHPYAQLLYALVVIFLLASHIIQDVLYVLVIVMALMAAVMAYGLHGVFT